MNLTDLKQSLENDECVLLLGPRAAVYEGEYLQDLFYKDFIKELKKQNPSVSLSPEPTQLVRTFLEHFKNPTDGLLELGKLLGAFYEQFEEEEIPIYDQIARLPFKHIISTTPDELMLHALKRADKHPHFFDFHFNKPEYNAEMNRRAVDLDKGIGIDSPLIYNLLGHYTRPDSVVMTDNDRLRFLEVVLQKEKEATLPANITYYFTKPPLKLMQKSYIFVGFDFNEWHMRMFMHLLRRTHEHLLPQSFSLQESKLSGEAHSFYTHNFNMHFVENNPEGFFTDLKQLLQKKTVRPVATEMKVMLLYHQSDDALRQELLTHLATLRNSGLIDVWYECKFGSHIDETVRTELATARIIIPLVTAELLASDQLYEYIEIAVARHHREEAKVCPILMLPCDIEHTVLSDLNTLYPKPRGTALSEKPDRSLTLTKFVKELRDIVERMLKKEEKV